MAGTLARRCRPARFTVDIVLWYRDSRRIPRLVADRSTVSGKAARRGEAKFESAASGSSWSISQSADLYRIADWGKGFFSITDSGHLAVLPRRDAAQMIDLREVVEGLAERNINTPVTIGFPDLLEHRMREFTDSFRTAIEETGYRGGYSGVYPIKVNQHRHLVRQVERLGRGLGFGFEVGSKPELLAAMGVTVDTPDRLIICNGFKEERYIQHIMLATKLGRQVVAVIESAHELDLLIDQARSSGVRPTVGIRIKLQTPSVGRWSGTTGVKAKFGLDIPGTLDAVERLREAEMLDCLRLLHCHMGSQISDINIINKGVGELARVFVELCQLGAPLQFIDVGGGLGVDYEGSQSTSDFSVNYGLGEYAMTVVYRIMSVCDDHDIPHPTIVTEAGRALVCLHSLLVFDVLAVNRPDRWTEQENQAALDAAEREPPRVLEDAIEAWRSVTPARVLEAFHDAEQARDEATTLFNVGNLSLADRALLERIYWSTCRKVLDTAREIDPLPEELQDLEVTLSDTCFCNLSVFQSLPDAWAVDQVFPIMPIQRLDEEPTRRATLVDITCDSDGKIDRFVDEIDISPVLAIHEKGANETYYLAILLIGAYQETLGDLHNLFGDANLVHVQLDDDGSWYISDEVDGDTVSEVLTYLQYEPRELYRDIRMECERSVRAGSMSAAESRELLAAYDRGLTGYTYLE
jgi:arginine decarboxylase